MARTLLAMGFLGAAVAAILCYVLLWRAPAFDPDRVAAAEARMWKAYYARDKQALARELIAQLRYQHGLSLKNAAVVGRDLAEASLAFAAARGDYERAALPQLLSAYEGIKSATGAKWDAAAAARAELDWWVARRTPGRDSAESVGQSITRLYSILYGRNDADLAQAGLLRARAAALRDADAASPDWSGVEELLKQSYAALAQAISS